MAPRVGQISKSPQDAPEPRKTRDEAIRDLLKAVDDDIERRNSEPVPDCFPCGYAGETEETKTYISEGTHQ